MKPKQSQAEPKHYPSDLTRTQWKRLKRLLPKAKPGGRPRSVDLREVLNGIFYITRGGCAWRMMPKDLPPWSTCYDYFYKWRNDGTWSRVNDALRTQVRHKDGRPQEPKHGHHRQPERQDHRTRGSTRQGRAQENQRPEAASGRGHAGDGRGGGGPLGGHPGPGRGQAGPEEVGGPIPEAEENPGRRDLQRRDRGVGRGTRRLDLRVGHPPRGAEEVRGAAVAVDRRADIRLVGPISPTEQGLRGVGGVEQVGLAIANGQKPTVDGDHWFRGAPSAWKGAVRRQTACERVFTLPSRGAEIVIPVFHSKCCSRAVFGRLHAGTRAERGVKSRANGATQHRLLIRLADLLASFPSMGIQAGANLMEVRQHAGIDLPRMVRF